MTPAQAALLWKAAACWLPFPEAADALAACGLPSVRFANCSNVLCQNILCLAVCGSQCTLDQGAEARRSHGLIACAQVLRHALQEPQGLLDAVGDIVGYAQQHSVGPSLEVAAKSMGFGYVKARRLPFPLSDHSTLLCTCYRGGVHVVRSSVRKLTRVAISLTFGPSGTILDDYAQVLIDAAQARDYALLTEGDILRRLVELTFVSKARLGSPLS